MAPPSTSTDVSPGRASAPDAIVYNQPDRRFRGPAYRYIRAADKLPSYADIAADADPLCKVKLFLPGSRFTYLVCAVTDYDGTLVVSGVMVSPLGPDCDGEFGDSNLEEFATTRSSLGLPLERDLSYTPMRMSEVQAEIAAGRVP